MFRSQILGKSQFFKYWHALELFSDNFLSHSNDLKSKNRYKNFICCLDGYGVMDEFGNWSGLIGMLQRKEADLSIGDVSITYARSQVQLIFKFLGLYFILFLFFVAIG